MDNVRVYQWLYGEPTVSAEHKLQPEDFFVSEQLGYELTGEGEHVFVRIQKKGLNTLYVAEHLAKFAQIPAKLVSYAGLKDRHAVTEQWFGLHIPGKITPDFTDFQLEGVTCLDVKRHHKKLKIGSLKANRFEIILRHVTDMSALLARLPLINEGGVPNYFGDQRFGKEDNNLVQALRWAKQEINIKDRQKRSFYLSAARSEIFNQITSTRIHLNNYCQVMDGDALQLAGRGSWFVANEEELTSLQARVEQGELFITAPLVGDAELGTQRVALDFEQAQLQPYEDFLALFKRQRLESQRRAMLVKPKEIQWHVLDEQTIKIVFLLSVGSFATSVLRELVQLNE